MTETIQTAMDRLMTISVEPQDYVAEDGLLYCGSCKTPKEAFFPNGKKLFGRDRHPAECRCRQATREKQEKEERARLHYEKVQRLKLQGFTDWAMQHWTFANDHGQNPQMQLAQRYVAHWPEIRDKNVGLLLWGGVGTGKSFMAGCIANALMEQEVAVCMTNFARIMNELNSTFAGRNEVVDRLCSYPLLVIDDFGMERGTEYALEQIHQMKNRDIRTIEQSELEELPQDAVEHGLPQEERLKNLLDKVRNPYCYLDNGIIVKLNFAPRGSSTLSERVGRCFQSAS